jgi:hypothetical protein
VTILPGRPRTARCQAPGQQHLGGADARDDRLQEEVPPQDQQLYRDPGHQQQAGQVPGGEPGPGAGTDQLDRHRPHLLTSADTTARSGWILPRTVR